MGRNPGFGPQGFLCQVTPIASRTVGKRRRTGKNQTNIEGQIRVDAVEKVGHATAATFLGIFSRGRGASGSRLSAPESRLSEVYYVSRYPLISTICSKA